MGILNLDTQTADALTGVVLKVFGMLRDISVLNPNGQNSNGLTQITPTTELQGLNLDNAFSSLLLMGASIGGIAGTIASTAGTIGLNLQNINKINAAQKAGGITPAQKMSKVGSYGAIVGAGADLASSFLPDKKEYSGEYGNITLSIDNVWDMGSNVASMFGPMGMAIGGGMKGISMLSKGFNALTGGLDGKTSTDAILTSSPLLLTPIGMINTLGGKSTESITKNNEVFANTGNSYTGTSSLVDTAMSKMGKYGAFSSGARSRANRLIRNAKNQQNIVSDISSNLTDRNNILSSMDSIYDNNYLFNLQGGYNQMATLIGRHGMILLLANKARKIIKAYGGTKIEATNINPEDQAFNNYLKTLPKNQLDTNNYRVRDYWKFNGSPKNFNEALSRGMFFLEDDGKYHARSVAENPETGDIEYMKAENHPTRYMESDWYDKGRVYNSDGSYIDLQPKTPEYNEWLDFVKDWELIKQAPYWKYVRRKNPIPTISIANPNDIPEFLKGGSVISVVQESFIDITNPNDIPEFLKGGSVNVIPEGALHARKHNIDIDGITHKGIPVVSENSSGEVTLQAEVERAEVIFRLEVTQKLERLYDKYFNQDSSLKDKDDCALEAGKLIVKELLHNTQDNVGLL